ncbi:MAG: putative DNA binding domain-containing protein [Acidobacteriota bacterium]|nr:putative DNA binding domain-containing protein [Acidobacteriota bacterium]
MSAILPINLDALLHCRGVESERVEFKASWNPDTTGVQVLRTICAFANDYHNLNGGYVVIGVGESGGRAMLPPAGLSAGEVEAAQKWIRANCNRLDPAYPPILSPETVDGRFVLVVWAPASEMRPHRAPAEEGSRGRFWVRLGAETVDAEQRGDMLRGLIQQTARVPWDDRRASDARVEDLREAKVREYLRDVSSGLLDEPDARDVYRRMRITARVNDHEVPRNAGLLFFSSEPVQWFRGARIEVVQFAADRAGDVQEERAFGGALVDQIRGCLNHLENLSASHLQKQRDRSQVRGWVSYPLPALRETLVNAVYHRGYDVDQPEPTKVYLYPSRVEVFSYPGPVPGIEHRHLVADAVVRAAPARNRRIGEFLKELGLAEGRLSGLPKVFRAMEENGSPAPSFDFDEQRTFFQATLPAHPEYGALSALRDAAHLRALGEDEEAIRRIESAWASNPTSAILATEMIRLYAKRSRVGRAEEVFETFEARGPASAVAHVANTLVDVLLEAGDERKAEELLKRDRPMTFGQDAIDAAILARRLRDARAAHRYFERAGDAVYADPRALLEFAQTKIWLARESNRARQHASHRRLLAEARTLLERVIQLDASPTRHAWAWRELARTRNWLRAPFREVEDAYRKAIEYLPAEIRFVRELETIRASRR